ERALEQFAVAVVPGFVGRQDDGALSLLGRGGTDLTAILVAHQLDANHCRLIKDVDGIYEFDPASHSAAPKRYRTLTWADAAMVNGGVVQGKAISFAERYGLAFEVAGLDSDQPSRICCQSGTFYQERADHGPLHISLLGAGIVGLGVYRHLAS